ncbi:10591_t:CDS:1, partial [Gigaspora rosea]
AEQKINLIRHNQLLSTIDSFPIVKKSPRLSAMQQWYLYEEVRKHIQNPLKQDNYCSMPQIPKPKKEA